MAFIRAFDLSRGAARLRAARSHPRRGAATRCSSAGRTAFAEGSRYAGGGESKARLPLGAGQVTRRTALGGRARMSRSRSNDSQRENVGARWFARCRPKNPCPRVPANDPGPLECRRIPGYSGPSDVLTRPKELSTPVAVVAGLARFVQRPTCGRDRHGFDTTPPSATARSMSFRVGPCRRWRERC